MAKRTDHVHTAPDLTLPYHRMVVREVQLNFAASGRVAAKRVDSYMTKEPTTIAWLDTFGPDDVLFDVGANVGMYTIYAAKMTGCKVHAFEPEALNYAELNKNIYLNGLYDLVRSYCVGISDEVGLSTLYLSRFAPSYSHHDARDNRFEGPATKLAPSAEARPKQGCMTLTLDGILVTEGHQDAIPAPTHLKIDVDGFEDRVVRGAEGLLQNGGLKTVLIETDFKIPGSVAIMKRMAGWGWKYSTAQVTLSRHRIQTKTQWEDDLAAGKGGCNIIYYKDDAYDEVFKRFAMNFVPEGL